MAEFTLEKCGSKQQWKCSEDRGNPEWK